MANSRAGGQIAPIVAPHDAQRLRQACRDLDDWPRSWHIEPADIGVGRQIVAVLAPFLLHLLDQGLSKPSVSRHRDNLWLLGGEFIRRRYEDHELAQCPVADAIRQLVEGDGGPLIWPRITEAEQDALDTTCRKLDRFLRHRTATHDTG